MEALNERIDRSKSEMRAKVKDDTALRELAGIVRLRYDQLSSRRKTMKEAVDSGRASKVELETMLLELQEKTAEAKVALAKRREELTEAAAGGALGKLTAELASLAVDQAEARRRLEILAKRFRKAKAQLQMADKAEVRRNQFAIAQRSHDDLLRQRQALLRRAKLAGEVAVILVGADDKPAPR